MDSNRKLFVLLIFCFCVAQGNGMPIKNSFSKIMSIVHPRQQNVQPHYLELPYDHWQISSAWQMRWWANDLYWSGSPDSPVFLAMGGEGPMGPPGGQMLELAEKFSALTFSIEHRFYGESLPAGPQGFATSDLRTLTVDQALADAAVFRQHIHSLYNLSSASRWVTFGGSYSGELAAWARIKYSHLFYAAVASSAPVTASVDYDGYDPIVAGALNLTSVGGSPQCHAAVAEAFRMLEQLMNANRSALQNIFQTCTPVISDGDCFLLHDFVSDDWLGLVQYNNMNAIPNIASRCVEMLDTSRGTPFDRLQAITLQRLTAKGDRCLFDEDPSGVTDSLSFDAHLQGYRNTSNPARAFPFQMCMNGVGHDQTCKPELGCIFSPKYASRAFFQLQCDAAFDVPMAQTDEAVSFNEIEFGGNQSGGSRIVFVNGDIDPFHAGGVIRNTTEHLHNDVIALVVSGGSHCQDMGRSDPLDSASMKAVKVAKAALLTKWLSLSPS